MLISSIIFIGILLNVQIFYHQMVTENYQLNSNNLAHFLNTNRILPDSVQALETSTKSKIKQSISIINEALDKYSLEEISISFNGGKDCLVMLCLYLAALNNRQLTGLKIQSVYIHYEDTFEEIEKFNRQIIQQYNLKLERYNCALKSGFEHYLKENNNIKAVIVGNRYTDPYSNNLENLQMTDNDWPRFMRIHPILNWTYQEIWYFIVALQVPYCGLYDAGYTSIGGINTTVPNPYLKKLDFVSKNQPLDYERLNWFKKTESKSKNKDFYPAYYLQNDNYERESRKMK